MTAKPPPVPAENQSPHGTGDANAPDVSAGTPSKTRQLADKNVDQQGRQGNSKINTTHQGYQQDR
ncbi:hypothetical protein CCR97_30470 [Rhodoplanes elegans]|uniref:Uncharacterized protein n=1 Tax=Rhodoplanes elegans TaxID=29408 RepID=A0A327K6R9_9BRAD|nr:hypothetical protein [Rhodoplanes elegans]MBK5962483.1 hypothetical protein [Rhodoplanes elegans]RAI33375.1 hypothetical protein CH338_22660 [Rhodoplanes elegans]